MTKAEFLQAIETGLAGLPHQDREERINFYSEIIDDRIEEGLSEEAAINEIGSVDEIIRQTVTDRYYTSLQNPPKQKNRLPVWVIVLLCVGAPLWISLAAAAFSIVVSIYATIWSVAVTLWAVFGALVGAGAGCILGGIIYAIWVHPTAGLLAISAGMVCTGLSILMFYGCMWSTKGFAWLTKIMVVGIKNCFVRKEKKNA